MTDDSQVARFLFLKRYLPPDERGPLDSLQPLIDAIGTRRAAAANNTPVNPRLAAARSVMNTARTICTIRVETPHLVVECDRGLGNTDRLKFARSIADADAVIVGSPRNIYFYENGAEFARADRLQGVRLTR